MSESAEAKRAAKERGYKPNYVSYYSFCEGYDTSVPKLRQLLVEAQRWIQTPTYEELRAINANPERRDQRRELVAKIIRIVTDTAEDPRGWQKALEDSQQANAEIMRLVGFERQKRPSRP